MRTRGQAGSLLTGQAGLSPNKEGVVKPKAKKNKPDPDFLDLFIHRMNMKESQGIDHPRTKVTGEMVTADSQFDTTPSRSFPERGEWEIQKEQWRELQEGLPKEVIKDWDYEQKIDRHIDLELFRALEKVYVPKKEAPPLRELSNLFRAKEPELRRSVDAQKRMISLAEKAWREALADLDLVKASHSDPVEPTVENGFRKGKNWLLVFGSKEVTPRPRSCQTLEDIQYLLRNPDALFHPLQLPAGDVQTLIATNAQIRELLLEGSASVSDLRGKDQYSVDNAANIYKKFQEFQNELKQELTVASLERREELEFKLKETKELANKLEEEQSQKAKLARNANKRIDYLIEKKIRPYHQNLARYLRKTIKREKNCLIYKTDPGQPVVWEF
ncbi:MAG: hypothetical protein O7B35_18830, partial [Deltaproteobacteria bacterium]|nr:hypothetical protein [Deltaproteobacteria bacterium]